MSNDIKLIRESSGAPSIVNRSSLFDVLLNDSLTLSPEAESVFFELRDILTYGGDKHRIGSERTGAGDKSRTRKSKQPNPVFNVLALDVAVVFPKFGDSVSPAGAITGQQICLCKSATDSEARGTWYKSALDEYFEIPPGGSLLTFPGVRQNLTKWWLIRPDSASLFEGAMQHRGQLDHDVVWKDHFIPKQVDAKGFVFEQRFNQYGTAVFKQLCQVQSKEATQSSVILWLYIGPPDQDESITDTSPLWGVSLFSVLRPIKQEDLQQGTHWTEDESYSKQLGRSVEQLYFYLMSAAYKTVEYGHRRLLYHKKEFETTVAQAVAHEFKNLMQDISSLGGTLYSEFSGAIRKVRQQPDLPAGLDRKLSESLSSLRQLSNLSKLTSAIALASYWLTTPDARNKIIFEKDPNCQVFEAVVHLALHLCKETRPEWQLQGPSVEEVCQTLGGVYGTSKAEELVGRLDVALLLFVVSEPVRNLRSNDPGRPNVYIHTEVKGNTLHIMQKTLEQWEPKDHHSRGAARINKMLQAGNNMSGQFARIDETVRVVTSTPNREGVNEVIQRTEIEVFGFPIKA